MYIYIYICTHTKRLQPVPQKLVHIVNPHSHWNPLKPSSLKSATTTRFAPSSANRLHSAAPWDIRLMIEILHNP